MSPLLRRPHDPPAKRTTIAEISPGDLCWFRVAGIQRMDRDEETTMVRTLVGHLRATSTPVASCLTGAEGEVTWHLAVADPHILHATRPRLLVEPAAPPRPQGLGARLVRGLPRRDADLSPLAHVTGERFTLITLAAPLDDPDGLLTAGLRARLEHVALFDIPRGAEEVARAEQLAERLEQIHACSGALWAASTVVYASSPRVLTAVVAGLGGHRADGNEIAVCDDPETVKATASGRLVAGPPADPELDPLAPATLATSDDFAALIAPPSAETPGLPRRRIPEEDRVPARRDGDLLLATTTAGHEVRVAPADLRRHVAITGVSGSGKTNAVFGWLLALNRAGISWLVLEPRKTEARSLAAHIPDVRVFTLGRETPGRSAPFRLNPLEPVEGMSVWEHLDLVRTALLAAFDLWEPLPQVLTRALQRTYADHGVDLQAPLPPGHPPPRLSDLARAAAAVVDEAGYDPEVRDNLRSALCLRIESLCEGPKGAIFDCTWSVPIHDLLDMPTVIEIHLTSPDEVALALGLLATRIAAFRLSQGSTDERLLRHVLVLEEAQELLRRDDSEREQAREVISSMLATLRATGQGIVVVSSAPSELVTGVLRNTSTKLVLRTTERNDLEAVAASLGATSDTCVLTGLDTGEGLLTTPHEDAPLHVRTLPIRDELLSHAPDDTQIAASAARYYLPRLHILQPMVTCRSCPSPCTLRGQAAHLPDGHQILARIAAGDPAALVEPAVRLPGDPATRYCALARATGQALGPRAADSHLATLLAEATAHAAGLTTDVPDLSRVTEALRSTPPVPCPACGNCTLAPEATTLRAATTLPADLLGEARADPQLATELATTLITSHWGVSAVSDALVRCLARRLRLVGR